MPVEVTTSETIKTIHDMVLADQRLKVWEIVEAIGISDDSVVSILNEHLGMRAIQKMDAAFAHNRPQTQLCEKL